MYLGKERFIEKATKLESILDGYKQGTGVHDRRMHCRAGRSNCWVDWRGNMSVCGMIPSGENNVLNKGFSDCWESVKRDAARITLPEKCADCPYACICNVCAAVCMCETGRYHTAPDYVCRFSRLTCENMLRLKNRMTGGESTDEV